MRNRFLFHVKQSAVELTRSMVPRELVTNVIGFDPWDVRDHWQTMYMQSTRDREGAQKSVLQLMDSTSRLMDEFRELRRMKGYWEHKANELAALLDIQTNTNLQYAQSHAELSDNLARLAQHCAAAEIAYRDDSSDDLTESWRSLPAGLQDLINQAVEQRDSEQVGGGHEPQA